MAKRNLYLTNTPVEEALSKYLGALQDMLAPAFETVPSRKACNRVTKEAVFAKYCSPLFNAAAMDGIAVVAERVKGAGETSPMTLKKGVDFVVVDTGDAIRAPYDAVIMAEDTVEIDENTVQILAAAASWQHVRPIGEDIVAGEMLIPGKHKIRPVDIGVLLSGGISEVSVYRKPAVAVIPTGTEIIEPGETPLDGQIIESNGGMFVALTERLGGACDRLPIVKDDYALLKAAVKSAADKYDAVLINAGSSAGTEDYTVSVLRELGEVYIHGVAIKPGKPVILAVVDNKPVIGIPGYPVSAFLAFQIFVSPVLSMLSGVKNDTAREIEAVAAKRMVSSLKHREYVRVKVGRVGGRYIASPLARGAGAAMSLVRADGFLVIPQNSEGVEAGDTARIELYRPVEEIKNTVVAIGSHDLILDVISDMMSHDAAHLSSTHVGSLAGLMSLKRKEAHIAPIHLLDEKTGEYNIPYIKRMFDNKEIALIKGVGRTQGLIVKRGNPLGIEKLSDIAGFRYVNRQRGAGTRILLDYLLKQEGIDASSVNGYDRVAATHMAVAAAVKSDSADVGMGISAAASAMELDFIPIKDEEYDFAVSTEFLESEQIKIFLDTLRGNRFHSYLRELGGYSCDRCGEVLCL